MMNNLLDIHNEKIIFNETLKNDIKKINNNIIILLNK